MRKTLTLALTGILATSSSCIDELQNLFPNPDCQVYQDTQSIGLASTNFVDVEKTNGQLSFSNLRQGANELLFTKEMNSSGQEYQMQLFDFNRKLLYTQSINLEEGTTTLAHPSYLAAETLRIIPKENCTAPFEVNVEETALRF